MSILITGMHKPKSCEECPFKDYEQGFCFASAGEDGNFLLCTGGIAKNEIHPNCPIIEIPKHGRLIDANDVLALAKDVTLINGAKHRCIDATQIHELPPAERKGKWIIEHEPFTWMGYAKWHCSRCGFKCGYGQEIKNRTNCCPDCGADMRGEQNEQTY